MPKKHRYKTALVVGRFQPFHFGHLHLLKKALSMVENMVVAIGSSNVSNEQNPFSYEQRQRMLSIVITNEGWRERVKAVVPSPDFPDDEVWLSTLLQNAGEFDVALGNNEWTNGVLSQAGYNVVAVPHWRRPLYEGTRIRQLRNQGEPWLDRIPEYLWTELSTI